MERQYPEDMERRDFNAFVMKVSYRSTSLAFIVYYLLLLMKYETSKAIITESLFLMGFFVIGLQYLLFVGKLHKFTPSPEESDEMEAI
jgi:hypothetical protein